MQMWQVGNDHLFLDNFPVTNMHTFNSHSGDSSVNLDGVLLAPDDYAVLTMLQAASDWAGTSIIAFWNLDKQYLSKTYVHMSKFGRHIPF